MLIGSTLFQMATSIADRWHQGYLETSNRIKSLCNKQNIARVVNPLCRYIIVYVSILSTTSGMTKRNTGDMPAVYFITQGLVYCPVPTAGVSDKLQIALNVFLLRRSVAGRCNPPQ